MSRDLTLRCKQGFYLDERLEKKIRKTPSKTYTNTSEVCDTNVSCTFWSTLLFSASSAVVC
jgi:hypothetical protein